jgi:hypothetical protein
LYLSYVAAAGNMTMMKADVGSLFSHLAKPMNSQEERTVLRLVGYLRQNFFALPDLPFNPIPLLLPFSNGDDIYMAALTILAI